MSSLATIENLPSFHLDEYFRAPRVVQEALRYLYSLHSLKIKTRVWKLIFIKISRICHFIATKCHKTIKRAVSYMRRRMAMSIQIFDRFHESGRQAENGYVMSEGLAQALDFLSLRNRLYTTDKEQQRALVEEAQRIENQKMSPTPPQKCPPYIQTSIQAPESKSRIHIKLQGITGISLGAKEALSRLPEGLLMLALEDANNWKTKIPNPLGFILWRIQKYKDKKAKLKKL